jgi:hypothetical protein
LNYSDGVMAEISPHVSNNNELEAYKVKLLDLRERLIRALGVDTVNLLMERALEDVVTVYPGLGAIMREGDAMRLDGLDDSYASASVTEVRDAFSALYAVMLVMLGRMLGKEIALRLAGLPEDRRVFEGDSLAPR